MTTALDKAIEADLRAAEADIANKVVAARAARIALDEQIIAAEAAKAANA